MHLRRHRIDEFLDVVCFLALGDEDGLPSLDNDYLDLVLAFKVDMLMLVLVGLVHDGGTGCA